MARKKRPQRISKKVYCFIVEGCTEQNYIRLLKRTFRKSGTIKNAEGGNAKGVLKAAQKHIKKNQDYYSGYVIWFDGDKYFPSSDTNDKKRLEAKRNVEIYISEPCIENWLLAHFQPIKVKIATCDSCARELKKHIPYYQKNNCDLLDKHIDKQAIELAVSNYPGIGNIPQKYFIQ